jgi:hypothetical protein
MKKYQSNHRGLREEHASLGSLNDKEYFLQWVTGRII